MSLLDRMLERAVSRPVVVEAMRARHVAQALEIEVRAYPRPWSAGVFHDELAEARAGRREYLVARRGSRVLGYAGVMFVVDRTGAEAHVTNVAVHPDERRLGVASRLLAGLADSAVAHGCTAWTLEVRSTSTGAQELYRRFGFIPAGIRKNYYEGETDAIVMWCHDLGTPEYGRRLAELTP
jgi:ribosomal-protein-alanine N-acetyltransferase